MRVRAARPARFPKSQQLFVAFVPALVVVLSITGFVWAQKSVTVVADGATRRVTTQATDVAGALRDAGVSVTRHDIVTPPPDSDLADGTEIVVRRAVPVTLETDGESISLAVVGSTVADALVAAGLDPADSLGVQPALDVELRPGIEIVVPRTVARVTEERVALPYQTLRRPDASLPQGSSKVVTAGAAGSAVRIFRTLVIDGVAGNRVLVSERVLIPPVARVVAIGSAQAPKRVAGSSPKSPRAAATGQAARRPAAAPAGGRRLTVTATGYAPGSDGVDFNTATGARARVGVIAVDPKVIPLGTKLYVPGYGYGTAADTGGAIKGARIDLCFDRRGDAMLWGRRSVSVVILD